MFSFQLVCLVFLIYKIQVVFYQRPCSEVTKRQILREWFDIFTNNSLRGGQREQLIEKVNLTFHRFKNASCFWQSDYGSPVDMGTDALIGVGRLDSDFHWNKKPLVLSHLRLETFTECSCGVKCACSCRGINWDSLVLSERGLCFQWDLRCDNPGITWDCVVF